MKPGHTYCTVNIFGSKWGHILRYYWFAYFSGGKIPLFGVYWFEYQKIKHYRKKIVKIIKYIWGKWRNCHFKTKNVHVLVHFDIDFLLALPSFYEFFVWTFCIFCTSSSRQGLLQIFISRIIISKVKFLLGVCSYMVFILAW